MPLYEYECQRCLKITNIHQGFWDEPLKRQCRCGGELKRIVSKSTVRFIGTGWTPKFHGKDGEKDA